MKAISVVKTNLILFAVVVFVTTSVIAAPFAKKIPFTQPDGTKIELWGEGDEFYAVFETLDGYTVVFDPQTKAYHYAQRSADGNDLISAGVEVDKRDSAALGLARHVRIKPEAVKKRAFERFQRWDQAMQVSTRWKAMKGERRQAELAVEGQGGSSGSQPSPPSSTTTGTKVGLCLLIDFSDDPATIPQANIVNFCNGDNYTDYGNNGSVKKYYLDNSNNLLTYTNVVTIYIRAPQPKTYYNDTSKDCGEQGRLLIANAIAVMKALPNYNTEILPTFGALTVDGGNNVVAFNVFYAGDNGGVWAKGLWPHSGSLASPLELSAGGKKVYHYQISNISNSLEIGTFCHENGHMLCGFPDIYDYGYDSWGGAGFFCLMDYGCYGGTNGSNPVQICAYLKRAAGWANIIDLNSTSNLTATVTAAPTAGYNNYYRYRKPGVSTEYFLVENRQQTGHDASIPAAGVAVWHIDELGDKDNQSLAPNTTHANYEVTLVQADNLWHFEYYQDLYDAKDLYYAGNSASAYSNRLDDNSSPNAHWWDGTLSGINFRDFSVSGTSMTFISRQPGYLIIYVDINATGTNNGTSWTDAYTDLQSALSVALGGDEIWVAAGTYKPTTGTDRTISFVMKENVAIYGGFTGTETSRNQRDWFANQTILSGDIGAQGNNSDNSYHVVIGANNAILDGFMIAGGNANLQQGMYTSSGGGMFNDSSNPTVINCTFSGNSANYGGGMYNWSGSPTVINCVFNGNSAPAGEYPGCGGGMYNGSNSAIIINSTFIGNTGSYGGGMFNYYSGSPTITNCTFRGNLADYGGGMDNGNSSSPTINNCILWGNTAPYGPQIYNFDNSNPNITYSDVQGGTPGTGNINADPLFTGPDDLRLQAGSPCIDAGNNSAVPTGVTTDLAGDPRFIDDPFTVDTGAGTPPIVDMGAFEYNQRVEMPTFEPDAGGYVSDLQVVIRCSTSEATIHYTTNGLTPTQYDTVIESGGSVLIAVEPATTLKARAFKDDWTPSDVKTAVYYRSFIHYVSTTGSDDSNGLSWAMAQKTVQAAIDAAQTDDEIWVAAGTYKPTTVADRTKSIVMKEGVAIYGGFAGTETSRNQRNWVVNQTILSGDIGIQGDNSDNSYHVVIGANNATLDGFTIAGGTADGEDQLGGGMLNESSSPIVSNCTFSGNSAGSYGGGIGNVGSNPTVTNCIFNGNESYHGGGMSNVESSPTVTNCIFSGNGAYYGGGMFTHYYSNAVVTNCTFSSNEASAGGGMFNESSSPTITNCILWGDNPWEIDFADVSPSVNYSDVAGGWPTGTGNIDADPLFVCNPGPAGSGDLGDVRLQAGSPCIDAGDNSAVPTGVNTDLAQSTCPGCKLRRANYSGYGCVRVLSGWRPEQ